MWVHIEARDWLAHRMAALRWHNAQDRVCCCGQRQVERWASPGEKLLLFAVSKLGSEQEWSLSPWCHVAWKQGHELLPEVEVWSFPVHSLLGPDSPPHVQSWGDWVDLWSHLGGIGLRLDANSNAAPLGRTVWGAVLRKFPLGAVYHWSLPAEEPVDPMWEMWKESPRVSPIWSLGQGLMQGVDNIATGMPIKKSEGLFWETSKRYSIAPSDLRRLGLEPTGTKGGAK